ncbi:hypothetical protein KL925_003268 [Ogataea polymorpha]|nr:hypothetical protein KL937_005288 [Ogataea polymorpha]KAG7908996.1 hypothetical protein KL906_002490 [Ogataea polymorpha]KAG7926218.1 hypothetical protein KL925_003268 [Ogataea polymorpha]KAG7931061.1 hypothetical protein KL904_005287 [Ogataea polymorpha]KAG7935835.1 hypothetical protein KL934_002394 [Ogataea polymorpha]
MTSYQNGTAQIPGWNDCPDTVLNRSQTNLASLPSADAGGGADLAGIREKLREILALPTTLSERELAYHRNKLEKATESVENLIFAGAMVDLSRQGDQKQLEQSILEYMMAKSNGSWLLVNSSYSLMWKIGLSGTHRFCRQPLKDTSRARNLIGCPAGVTAQAVVLLANLSGCVLGLLPTTFA